MNKQALWTQLNTNRYIVLFYFSLLSKQPSLITFYSGSKHILTIISNILLLQKMKILNFK